MRRIRVLVAGGCLAVSAAQAAELSANLGLASDYLFRGIGQTAGPALQGGADWYDHGLYAGGWLSNSRLAGRGEFDAYGGYGRGVSLFDLFVARLEAGVDGYVYFGEPAPIFRDRSLDFAEVHAGIALGPASFKAYFAPDYANRGGPGYSLRGALRLALAPRLDLRATLAWNGGAGLRRYAAPLTADGRGRDYLDYGLALNLALPRDYAVYLQGGGTNLKLGAAPPGSVGQPKILVGVRKDFGF